jgi:hypothetical protein
MRGRSRLRKKTRCIRGMFILWKFRPRVTGALEVATEKNGNMKSLGDNKHQPAHVCK